MVVGETAVVVTDVPCLARELPVLIKAGGATTVEADRTDVIILHVLALELMHVVGAGLQVDLVAAVVAVLVDGDGARSRLAFEFATFDVGTMKIGRLDEFFLSWLELGSSGDSDKGESAQHKKNLHIVIQFATKRAARRKKLL